MGVDYRFSLENTWELDEAKKFFVTSFDQLDVKISISGVGDRKAFAELEGQIGKQELLELIENRQRMIHLVAQKDELTGLLSREYFAKRLATVDRSQVLPVAIINMNINDWRFANSNFGDEASDRLIQVIAQIIQSEAKPYYICGRMDGDIFGILIPMAKEGEAEDFVYHVKEGCHSYDDAILAPSVAAGIVYKTNVEENIEDLMSEAEYEMFQDKFAMKNAPEYKQRLEKGLK